MVINRFPILVVLDPLILEQPIFLEYSFLIKFRRLFPCFFAFSVSVIVWPQVPLKLVTIIIKNTQLLFHVMEVALEHELFTLVLHSFFREDVF